MTTRPGWRRAAAATTTLLLLAPLGAALAPTASGASGAATTIAKAAEPAQATASDFLYYMFPLNELGTQACTGVATDVTDAPYFAQNDCGFAEFTLAGKATKVVGELYHGEATKPFATADAVAGGDGTWQVDITPDKATWKPGEVTLKIVADGASAGESTFGYNLLGVEFDDQQGPAAPGKDVAVTGTLFMLDNDSLEGLSKNGVKAPFTFEVDKADGSSVFSKDLASNADGTFKVTVPAAATSSIRPGPESDFETVLALRATDAKYFNEGSQAAWAAEEAGTGALTLAVEPNGLLLENSFVSSVGWVKPGETYPSRIFVKNYTDAPATDVTVTVPAPDGATFTQLTADAGNARIVNGRVVWDLPSVPASTQKDGIRTPAIRTLVLEAKADTLRQDPELVWKDLSSTATLRLGTDTTRKATSHGPKVIPPAETYDTARYGDRPFPVVPVDYLDRKHQPENSGDKLWRAINSKNNEGSTFNLFQEMSLNQLFPQGTVPSVGKATADFPAEVQEKFTAPAPAGTCTGMTFPQAAGTPFYPERISDGFYQLPGTTEYYGADKYGTAVAGAVAGVGALMDIDSACGPTGKLVYDSAVIADPEIDYSDYDTDKDGVVDFFMVVFAGCGGNGASQLSVAGCAYPDRPYDNVWPHSSSLEFYYTDADTGLSGYVSDDQLKDLEGNPLYYTNESRTEMTTDETKWPVFVRVGPYNVNPETSIDKASVISHEYGHSLGLPDFYSLGSRETYGDWNLMATDKSQHMDVFSRQEMGWIVPKVLKPGQTSVANWTDSKQDTGQITWQRPDGTSYTLRESDGPARVQNAEAYVAKLPGRQLIDPAKFDTGDKASKSHAWWSGSGNDFGCPPTGGHNLDIALPGVKDLPAGSKLKLEFKSLWDIEWDYDYGFVLTSKDGGETFVSHESEKGYTTPASQNPNANTCQQTYGNGLTGTSGSYSSGNPATDRLLGEYPDSVFLADSYDISELVGSELGTVRFSYATDPGLARPGWFIDDVKVTATLPDSSTKVLFESNFEESGDPDDPSIFNGGCKDDLGSKCTKGWNYVDSSAEAPADHAYYMELRDRSGFDLDSNNENDRDPITFAPGLSLVYTDEAHGYGNVGTDNPPAQSPLDANPEPGVDTPNLADAAFTFNGVKRFTDSGKGHTDNYSNPAETTVDDRYADVENPWRFQYNCLTFDIGRMAGTDLGPDKADGNLEADVTFKLNKGCGTFDYGYLGGGSGTPDNTAPVARATASPQPALAGRRVTLNATATTDKETPRDLDYSWDFGDGGDTKDGTDVLERTTYEAPGTYSVTLTVTDPQGLTDVVKLKVVVEPDHTGGGSGGGSGGSDTGVQRVNAESDAVTARGSWRTVRDGDAVGNRYLANRPAAKGRDALVLRFTGPRLAVHFAKARAGGVGRVFIDGERVGRVVFRGDTRRPEFGFERMFRRLGQGTHRMRLVVPKRGAHVDHFVIRGRTR